MRRLRRVGPAHTIGDAVAFLPKEGILLLKGVNLSRHGDFAADQQQNQSAIRALFRKAPEP